MFCLLSTHWVSAFVSIGGGANSTGKLAEIAEWFRYLAAKAAVGTSVPHSDLLGEEPAYIALGASPQKKEMAKHC